MNPFTQRDRITDPTRFVGRWRELAVVFDRITEGRPVIVTGVSGIGRSSLITHVAQSAAVNMERPELDAFYIDLSVLPDAAACYELVLKALGSRGDNAAALEVALLNARDPVLLCLDGAESAIAADWGAGLLESMARIARRSVITRPARLPPPDVDSPAARRAMAGKEPALLLVVASLGQAPVLSEPYAVLGMGAFARAEIRLFADAYLESTGVQFSPRELHELHTLSLGHPAYLQRAAYHLFISHTRPDYDWREAFLTEAKDRPVPGAPLPPAVFEGGDVSAIMSFYGEYAGMAGKRAGDKLQITGIADMLIIFLTFIGALLAWNLSGNWLLVGAVVLAGLMLVVLAGRATP